jgi:hypothetical protein
MQGFPYVICSNFPRTGPGPTIPQGGSAISDIRRTVYFTFLHGSLQTFVS